MSNHPRFVFLGVTILLTIIVTVQSRTVTTTSQAMAYLSQFGYLAAPSDNSTIGGLVNADTLAKAVLDFQNFAGLNTTGELDEETMKTMALPRCGVPDNGVFGNHSKGYGLQGSMWPVKDLTYKITIYPNSLPKPEVDMEIYKAFSVWSEYTDLTFTPKTSSPVDIEIKFVDGDHGDGFPFDGSGGTVGHAFFPYAGGDAHFDNAEQWTIGSYGGVNLFQAAAHEFGHSLGLSHSHVFTALMAPIYPGYDSNFKLDADDILNIQALYGEKTSHTTPTSKSLLCKDPKIDAIFSSADEQTIYALKGKECYTLTASLEIEGHPSLISDKWPQLPGDIDAAFSYRGRTYFFKGTKYWRYYGYKLYGDFPREIPEGFPGVPDHVNAIMRCGGKKKVCFFKNDKFWRLDPSTNPPLARYSLLKFRGFPLNMDAAFQHTNNLTYFFKNHTYYRYNFKKRRVDIAKYRIKGSTASLFGCK